MTRRDFAAALALPLASAAPAGGAIGLSPDFFGITRPPRTALEYLEYCHARGAGGVQAMLPQTYDSAYLAAVRRRAEEYGMYLEITTSLPGDDTSAFERTVKAAKEAGAGAVRSVCLSGRRYENFAALEDWNRFVSEAKARLARAVRIAEREKVPLGIENHKDWTIDEMVPLLESYSSEYLGACIDWGNNISLLDDPAEVIERLAPFAVCSHIKDMAVEECPDGFLLAEVPLGEGFLHLRRLLGVIRKARPQVRFSLDMLTRDPLHVPCLTERYWATFPGRNGRYLARTLALVRANKPRKPLPRMQELTNEQRFALEQENVARSIAYAHKELGL